MHPHCLHWVATPSNVMYGDTTIDAQLAAREGLVDVHTHAIGDDLPDLQRTYPHDRWPSIERTGDTEAHLTFGGATCAGFRHPTEAAATCRGAARSRYGTASSPAAATTGTWRPGGTRCSPWRRACTPTSRSTTTPPDCWRSSCKP